MKGIIGKKVGMTSIFDPSGKQTACTIIEAGPCVVTQVRTKENDGYEALQLAACGLCPCDDVERALRAHCHVVEPALGWNAFARK